MNFAKRAAKAPHPLAKKLLHLMHDKKTNLAVAADLLSQRDLLKLADLLGPEIAVLKTHVDILEDFTPDFGHELRKIAQRHQFLIFEDRKFADIGQTVSMQYAKGIYRIAEWADLVNAHVIPGPGIIEGLKREGHHLNRGLLLLAEMSSSGTLAKGSYTKKVVKLGEEHKDFVIGFIALRKLSKKPGMIHFTPGVKLHPGKDSLGQRYRTVEEVIQKNKSDLIIVGREIVNAVDPLAMAKKFKQKAWSCLSL